MGNVKETLGDMAHQERLRLSASVRRLPRAVGSTARRAVRAHPVALGIGAGAVAAGAVFVGFALARHSRRARVRYRVTGAAQKSPSKLARAGKLALRLVPALACRALRSNGHAAQPPLAHVARARRSPWGGADDDVADSIRRTSERVPANAV